jgi:D-alanine-D-alanine ligase
VGEPQRIVVLHGAVAADAPADDQDTLVQAEAAAAALRGLGFEADRLALGLDLRAALAALEERAPDLVFNLVEGVAGSGRLIHFGPSVLEDAGIPYTGAPLDALFLTSNKLAAKRMLALAGIATPAWIERHHAGPDDWPGRWIIKSIWEHASIGMDDGAVAPNLVSAQARLARAGRRGDWFAEAYIEGREINVALLGGPEGPTVLPPAEIRFDGYPPDKPRIAGYAAKWNPESFEYRHTPRVFLDRAAEPELVARLEALVLACWSLLRLEGYARVDFRVDAGGEPWVLEVNANPCLSPDAGLAATAQQAGIPYPELIGRIAEDGFRRAGLDEGSRTT